MEKVRDSIRGKLAKMIEEENAHYFLMGLNHDVYSSIWSQILALEVWSSPDKIFNMVSWEETHKNIMIRRDKQSSNNATFVVKHFTKWEFIIEKLACKHYGYLAYEKLKSEPT